MEINLTATVNAIRGELPELSDDDLERIMRAGGKQLLLSCRALLAAELGELRLIRHFDRWDNQCDPSVHPDNCETDQCYAFHDAISTVYGGQWGDHNAPHDKNVRREFIERLLGDAMEEAFIRAQLIDEHEATESQTEGTNHE